MASELPAATLRSCQKGDRAAFRALVELYQDRVYAFCLALTSHRSDAEDLAQETFVRVHGAIARFEASGPATLSTWILTIARRLCTDRARTRTRQAALTLELVGAAPRDGAAPADEQLARHDEVRALHRAIATLPVEQRAVIALQLWDDLDYEQIAAIEAIPLGTVRSRLARAKEALRRALDWPHELQKKETADGR